MMLVSDMYLNMRELGRLNIFKIQGNLGFSLLKMFPFNENLKLRV